MSTAAAREKPFSALLYWRWIKTLRGVGGNVEFIFLSAVLPEKNALFLLLFYSKLTQSSSGQRNKVCWRLLAFSSFEARNSPTPTALFSLSLLHPPPPLHQPSIYLFAIGRPSSQIAFRTFWLNFPCLLLCSRPSAAWLSIFPTVPRRAAATAGWETPSPAARLAPANLFPSASPRRSTTNKHPPTAAPREMETQTPNPVSFSFSFFFLFLTAGKCSNLHFLGEFSWFCGWLSGIQKRGRPSVGFFRQSQSLAGIAFVTVTARTQPRRRVF